MTTPTYDGTTPLDLGAIEAREKAATPGPWDACLGSGGNLCTAIYSDHFEDDRFTPICDLLPDWILEREQPGKSHRQEHRADMDFIAHARTDIPALIARIRYLEAELAKAQPKEPPKPPKPFRITGRGSHYSRDGVESEVEVSPCGDMQYPWLVTTENRCYSVDDFGYKIDQSLPDPLDIISRCENQEGEG
jgi:hypothetical protein